MENPPVENSQLPPEVPESVSRPIQIPKFGSISIRRSARRKSIGIKLSLSGECQLLAPANATVEQLKKAYEYFIPWLQRELAKQQRNPIQPVKFRFEPGGEFFFLGKKYVLTAAEQPLSGVVCQGEQLLTPPGSPTKIKLLMERFYRVECEKYITRQLSILLPRLKLEIEGFSINGARKRFGSCSSRKRLNFSWQLMMYPEELIELVILHELSHLKELNHSPAFYRVLASYLPDHRTRNEKLKQWTQMLSAYPK